MNIGLKAKIDNSGYLEENFLFCSLFEKFKPNQTEATLSAMEYATQILFFLGAIGVFNSLLVSLFFLLDKSLSLLPNRIFGWFLLVLNLRVLKSVFYSFSTTEPIAFLQSGPYFFLLIGPLFLTYIQMLVKSKHQLNLYGKTHLASWIFIAAGLQLLLPFHHHVALVKEVILPLINLQWLAYLLAAALIVRPSLSKIRTGTPTQQWLCLLILAMLILWAVYFFVSFQYFISGSIAFSLLFYAFYLYFVFHKKIAQSIFPRVRRGNARIIKQPKADRLLERLSILMQEKKPFVNPNLKSVDIAQQLNISTHELSHLINEYLNKTFTDFINEYRVEEAKQLIATDSRYTLEAIGNQAGFNSKSAFYKAFKKFQGTTPGRFKA